MTNMVEKVAKALDAVVHWEVQEIGTREENMRVAARAAIETMRDTTYEMIEAGTKREGTRDCEFIYRAMINAALENSDQCWPT